MILSVIIVSYNVKFFLEQCLSSLKKAIDSSQVLRGQTEVFIIDNFSDDGTADFLTPLFPEFRFLENKENIGFAKANNQAVSFCSGEFLLFLNPDTILAEDSLDICVSFMGSNTDAGAVGPKMIDGAGNYLKESKRGFPGTSASFFKMIGLARLFPHTKLFSAYYLGHLNEETSQVVDVLTGAFMMIRKSVFEITGGFDEQFFMYAEDIDLSYQISKVGYQNYYLPQSAIIHFKGESTRKDVKYVKDFYSAMELFIKKHFSGNHTSIHLYLLKLGIHLRRALAYFQLPLKRSADKSSKSLLVFIKGEPNEKKYWKLRLEDKKISTTENEKDATEMLYCQGSARSWKSIIEEITLSKRRLTYKFHGEGTHSAVGSYSSRRQGDIIEK